MPLELTSQKVEKTVEVSDQTVRIVIAYIEHNQIAVDALPDLIRKVQAALQGEKPTLAVPSDTVTDDYIVCLEDGAKVVMLKRYLQKRFNMTPEEYTAKWNLPEGYPMVTKNYSLKRSQIAKDQGLGKRDE